VLTVVVLNTHTLARGILFNITELVLIKKR